MAEKEVGSKKSFAEILLETGLNPLLTPPEVQSLVPVKENPDFWHKGSILHLERGSRTMKAYHLQSRQSKGMVVDMTRTHALPTGRAFYKASSAPRTVEILQADGSKVGVNSGSRTFTVVTDQSSGAEDRGNVYGWLDPVVEKGFGAPFE